MLSKLFMDNFKDYYKKFPKMTSVITILIKRPKQIDRPVYWHIIFVILQFTQ